MNESLLGILVWTIFGALVVGVDYLLRFFFPASTWTFFAAISLTLIGWFGMLFGVMIWSNRRRR